MRRRLSPLHLRALRPSPIRKFLRRFPQRQANEITGKATGHLWSVMKKISLETGPVTGMERQRSEILHAPRHSVLVRVTHWINTVSFFALVVSGIAILLAYPRMHWGETGTLGTPSLFDLPLPFVLDLGIRGPGRYLHFLAAWVSLFTGLVYAISGLCTQHFRKD